MSEQDLILNVDDYEAARYATTRILRQAGYKVIEASTGTEALEQVMRERPDLIVLDVNLPDISGLDVCKELKANPATRDLPILQMSASHVSTDSRVRGLESGADVYITQPVEPRELIATVNSLLRVREAQRETRASEQRFRVLIDAFSQLVWRTDAEGRPTVNHNEWRKFTGLENLTYEGWLEAVHPEDREGMVAAWNHALATSTGYERTYRMRWGDGRYHWVEVRGRPVLDADGKVIEWVGVCLDIDERRRLEERERLLAEVTRTLSSSLEYETTLSRITELLVPSFADVALIDMLDEHNKLSRVAAAYSDKTLADAAAAASAGGDRSSLIVPLIARGEVLGALNFLTARQERHFSDADASFAEELGRRVALAVDNARLYHQAVAGNRAKSDFLAVMSHELRTPLNAIIGYSDLLKAEIGGPITEMQGQQIQRIDASARHLLQLIEVILTFSRIEAGKEQLDLRPVDMVSLVQECLDLIAPLAASKKIELEDELLASCTINTDAGRVRQILLNLLSNGVKFTDQGRIRVELRTVDGDVLISVSDTGIGIAAADLERVFEPFRQIARSGLRATGGTGLGLAVSRRLAEMLGGEITVSSATGVGSTFMLRLPAN